MRAGATDQRKQRLFVKATELLICPLLISNRKRIEKLKRATNAATIPSLVAPQIDPDVLAKPRQQHQAVEIAVAVAPRAGARQLQWLPAIGLDLRCDAFLLSGLDDRSGQIRLAKKQREGDNLNVVVGSMIVFRGSFVATVLA